MKPLLFAAVLFSCSIWAQNSPLITAVSNAEGGNALIAPNTWVEIDGTKLAKANDARIWLGSDFVNGQMPTSLDNVSVTVNGKNAYVYYVSPTQVNILTPPDPVQGSATVQVTYNGNTSAPFTVAAKSLSPSFFIFGGGPYVAALHSDYTLLGPASLSAPGYTFTPAKPGDTVLLYANGFGTTTAPIVPGSQTQGGTLSTLPVITIGGLPATVDYAGLVGPGEFQLNVTIPKNAPNGDNAIVATYNGAQAAPAAMIAIQGSGAAPSTITFYAAPNGNDQWSGTLPAPNSAGTDGPLASLDRARALAGSISKTGLTKVAIQFRGGMYFLPSTVMFGAADSGTSATPVVYQNFPGETPVFSGGVRVQKWTNSNGNTWKATLPASTQYFENMFYNGSRRLRPRLGSRANSTVLGAYYRILNTVYLNAPPPPAAAPDVNCAVYIAGSGWECFDRFQYDPADPVTNTWKNLAPAAGNLCGQTSGSASIAGDIHLLVFEQFSTSKLPISCIDTKNHLVYLAGRTGMSQSNASEEGFIQGNRYLIENVQDQLTLPGQWFLDHSSTPWTLIYLANPGENPNTDTVIVPQLPQLLVANGLQYVTFQGLTFEHDNYTLAPTGHVSKELEPDISGAVSFQNSQYITFDGGTVTQTAGTGLEFISCLNAAGSPRYCVSPNLNAVTANNVIQNSAFYDIGALGIRIGEPYIPANNDANVPQSMLVQNNVVEGYGRNIPASFGIGQGMGHDNLYTHNDVYDGYHCAISTSQSIAETVMPSGVGNANNVISFNHVYNLLQGIMNDGGSLRIDAGNQVFTAAGNKIVNNKIHDVTDASVMDSNGYGGHGVYMDDGSGLVDVENNLIYRVSGFGAYTPHGPPAPNQANTIKNNIIAYAGSAIIGIGDVYQDGVPPQPVTEFNISNNLFYFDRSTASNPPFRVQGGCTYSAGFAYTTFELFSNNMYWRTDGAFASDIKAFHVQPQSQPGPNTPCSADSKTWNFYTFGQWQQLVNEDSISVIKNPGFKNPAYPADDYSLPNGSPGAGFVVFDPNLAGRTDPVLKPPAVPATFPTKNFNPATDF
ncbi:MAG TPA: IPT/TIG domain-containing protein [Bryobacteraceae bacterium]|jgi:uncharacterized protein (TIGR03437 family)